MYHLHFRLKFCHNKNIGLENRIQKNKQRPIQRIVLNFNQNWLDIHGFKFFCIQRTGTELDQNRNILGIRIYPNKIYIFKYIILKNLISKRIYKIYKMFLSCPKFLEIYTNSYKYMFKIAKRYLEYLKYLKYLLIFYLNIKLNQFLC